MKNERESVWENNGQIVGHKIDTMTDSGIPWICNRRIWSSQWIHISSLYKRLRETRISFCGYINENWERNVVLLTVEGERRREKLVE